MKKDIKKLIEIIKKTEIKILPGQIAFFLFVSFVPIVTLILYLGLILSIGTDSIQAFVNKIFPLEVSSLLIPYVNNVGIDFSTIIFMITGFLVASNGPNSIILASNSLYKFDDKNYLKRRIKAFIMTILLVLLFIFIILFLAFGDKIISLILNIKILSNIKSYLQFIYILLKWPLGLFIIFFIVKLLYIWSLNIKIPSKYMTKGAIFTTFTWYFATIIYSIYINNFQNYNLFYGGLSNIIMIMMWVYLLSYLFVIGMIINYDFYNQNMNKKQ